MPWQEVVTAELRHQFVHDALRRVVPVTELCAAYGISCKALKPARTNLRLLSGAIGGCCPSGVPRHTGLSAACAG